jgi:hypothetical protein
MVITRKKKKEAPLFFAKNNLKRRKRNKKVKEISPKKPVSLANFKYHQSVAK